MKALRQKGIGHLLVILVVVVALAVGLAGYAVMQAQNKDVAPTNTSQEETTQETELSQTTEELDQTNSELDQSLDTTELDKDIDAML